MFFPLTMNQGSKNPDSDKEQLGYLGERIEPTELLEVNLPENLNNVKELSDWFIDVFNKFFEKHYKFGSVSMIEDLAQNIVKAIAFKKGISQEKLNKILDKEISVEQGEYSTDYNYETTFTYRTMLFGYEIFQASSYNTGYDFTLDKLNRGAIEKSLELLLDSLNNL